MHDQMTAEGPLDRSLVSFSGIQITLAGILSAVVVLLGAWLVSLLARRAINRFVERREHANRALLYTVSRIVHYTVLALGLLFAVSLLGVPLDRFAVFAGAVAVGLGFGLQSIFSNFVSGPDPALRQVAQGRRLRRAGVRGARGGARHQDPRHHDRHQRQHRHPRAELRVRRRSGGQLDAPRRVAPAARPVRRRLRHRQGAGEGGGARGRGGGAVHARPRGSRVGRRSGCRSSATAPWSSSSSSG